MIIAKTKNITIEKRFRDSLVWYTVFVADIGYNIFHSSGAAFRFARQELQYLKK